MLPTHCCALAPATYGLKSSCYRCDGWMDRRPFHHYVDPARCSTYYTGSVSNGSCTVSCIKSLLMKTACHEPWRVNEGQINVLLQHPHRQPSLSFTLCLQQLRMWQYPLNFLHTICDGYCCLVLPVCGQSLGLCRLFWCQKRLICFLSRHCNG